MPPDGPLPASASEEYTSNETLLSGTYRHPGAIAEPTRAFEPMPVSTADLWNMLLASRLASPVSLSNLQARFNQVKGAETESNAATVAQWLVAQGALSSYQAKVLLAGQPGPFIYGEYTVYDRIAVGRLQGMFRALHPPTRHRVMLSFHTGQVVQNKQWWSVLVDQIALAAQVVHPHVARVYHLVDVGQFKFTAIEDLQGESADAQLATGPIHWAVAARMVRQTALGLSRMHELKQLHGAIRPENLWIDQEENVKLLMTPLARNPLSVPAQIDLSAAQQSEDVVRQADYLAPEMGQAGQAPGPWTDIYALGCTLFHLLAGRPPYSGRHSVEIGKPFERTNSVTGIHGGTGPDQPDSGGDDGERAGAATAEAAAGGRCARSGAGAIGPGATTSACLRDLEQVTGIRIVVAALPVGAGHATTLGAGNPNAANSGRKFAKR